MIDGARVIVGVDGSYSSLAVVHRAVQEARKRDALLVPVIAWMASDGDSLRPLSELEYAARQRLDTAFELTFDGYPEGVRIQPRVLRAEPGRALVTTADQPDDLLIVGSGRHARLQHVVHGTVARYCWAHAACEVLIVPPAELPERPQPIGAGGHCHAGIGYLN
ncbi:nucleotide-binding universal stress UspA family protein [Streptacidiphilus sp. MAP12-16]|uniref:universal stress protein n=1 Tax=Streptacidiphilus sp. MAP12-16 TaxID=3156300 RepID=UPI003512AC55